MIVPRDEVAWGAGMPPPLHDTWLRKLSSATILFFPLVNVIVVGLRVYGRVTMKQFGIDDALIVFALMLALAYCGSMYMYIFTAYMGIHGADIPEHDPQPMLIWSFVNMCLYNPILALVKSSVLFFLLRLAGTKSYIRWTIIALNTFNILLMIATFLVVVFGCTPIAGAYDLNAMATAKCVDPETFSVSTAIITIITDILVVVIPFWIILGLKMPRKVKLSLVAVFFLGIIVTVVSCIRLKLLINVFSADPLHPDPEASFDFGPCCESIEGNLAILTASMPALWPLLRQWFPRLVSRLNSSYQNGSTGWTGNNGAGAEQSAKRQTYMMKSMRSNQHRSELRSNSPSGSEEEIMTYNGILRTTAVTVENDTTNASDCSQDERDKKDFRMKEYSFPG